MSFHVRGDQPIRIIFPFTPGGSGDALTRLIADKMRAALNRPVIVENRTGAGGRIGVQAVKTATPDGTTLLLVPTAPLAVYQHVYTSLEYDRGIKLPAYAAARIPEVWIANLKEQTLLVFRDPSRKEYRTSLTFRRGDTISLLAFPEITFSVDELLGPELSAAQ